MTKQLLNETVFRVTFQNIDGILMKKFVGTYTQQAGRPEYRNSLNDLILTISSNIPKYDICK